jgi:hypothetical protein
MIARLRPGGFSFIEIAIAVLILALGILPMIGVFVANSEETRANKNRSFAATLAASVLERYRKFRPATLDGKFAKGAVTPEIIAGWESSKTLPETSKELSNDPLLSPPQSELKDEMQKDFFRRLDSFHRVVSFEMVGKRMGKLTCAVAWKENAAGHGERVITYTLATILTDPIFPTGRDEPAGN